MGPRMSRLSAREHGIPDKDVPRAIGFQMQAPYFFFDR